MQQEFLINWAPQETRVALIEGGQVQELHIERALDRGIAGNIYLGKVQRVLPGMQSAFIDIGLEKAAFLHVADLWQRQESGATPFVHAQHNNEAGLPIEKRIFEGQSLLVQVLKDPIGSKGARLSTQISIAGRALVFLPQDDHIGVSQRISFAEREALRLRVQQLCAGAPGGFILRTNAEDASDKSLQDDMDYLRKTWAKIQQSAQSLPSPALVHQELSLALKVLRDMVGEPTLSIRIDSREQHEKMRAFAAEYMPAVAEKIQHYNGEKPIFDIYAVDEAVRKSLGKRVDLKSGGYLVIDQTEAMTTIDVNTGAYVGARSFAETVYKTNLEAAGSIARELRLRNSGGIIIVDFIDMQSPVHRANVLAELQKKLKQDRVKTVLGGFTSLGLVEMTRKRTHESLERMLCETCPACAGRASVKTVRSVAYEILREILREARQFNPKEFRIVAHPAVAEAFLDEESAHLAGLSDFIGKPISLQSDPMMTQEQYDIVLL